MRRLQYKIKSKSYIQIALNVAFNLSLCYKKDTLHKDHILMAQREKTIYQNFHLGYPKKSLLIYLLQFDQVGMHSDR